MSEEEKKEVAQEEEKRETPLYVCCICGRNTLPVISPADEAKRIVLPNSNPLRSIVAKLGIKNLKTGEQEEFGRVICAQCLTAIYNAFAHILQSGMWEPLGIRIQKEPQIYKPGAANVVPFPGKSRE